MGTTKIDWATHSINPVKGLCPVDCKDTNGKPYCYARRMYRRFKWNPEIRYIEPGFTIAELAKIKKPVRIFWGSTIELFGPWIPDLWLIDTFEIVRQFPQHTHIFLTKQPHNLAKFSPFPPNCWVGVSATNAEMTWYAMKFLKHIEASVKFVSFEPLLAAIPNDGAWPLLGSFETCGIGWIIIGSQTGPGAVVPKLAWVTEIMQAANKARIPLFLKENLLRQFPNDLPRRQEAGLVREK